MLVDVVLAKGFVDVTDNDVSERISDKVALAVQDNLSALNSRVIQSSQAACALSFVVEADIAVTQGPCLGLITGDDCTLDVEAVTLKELLHVEVKEALFGQVTHVEGGPLLVVLLLSVRLSRFAGLLLLLLSLEHLGQVLQLLVAGGECRLLHLGALLVLRLRLLGRLLIWLLLAHQI